MARKNKFRFKRSEKRGRSNRIEEKQVYFVTFAMGAELTALAPFKLKSKEIIMETKRYYYIKLKKQLFDDNGAMDFLLSQENGSEYAMIYILLCMKALSTEGLLASSFNEILVPFSIEKLTRDLKYFSTDTMRVALEIFKGLGLIYEEVDGTYKISNYEEFVGCETNWAMIKRNQRKKALPKSKK